MDRPRRRRTEALGIRQLTWNAPRAPAAHSGRSDIVELLDMEIVSMETIAMESAFEGATVGFLVWRLSMKWKAAVDRAVAPLELTHAQYSVVSSLLGMERSGRRPSQRELADHTGLEPVYISKLVRALEQSGFVARTADETDSRAVRLALTERGRDVASEAIEIVGRLLDELTESLGGTRGARTARFADELRALLAQPIAIRRPEEEP